MASDGSFLFTDPAYGLQPGLGGPARQANSGSIPCASARGEPILIADDFDAPNGLVLSPDEKSFTLLTAAKAHTCF